MSLQNKLKRLVIKVLCMLFFTHIGLAQEEPLLANFLAAVESKSLKPLPVTFEPPFLYNSTLQKPSFNHKTRTPIVLEELDFIQAHRNKQEVQVEAQDPTTKEVFQLVFSNSIFLDESLNKMQAQMGLAHREQKLISNLQIKISDSDLYELVKIWGKSKLKWNDFWSPLKEKQNSFISIKKSLAVRKKQKKLYWQEQKISQQLLFAMWAQCGNLQFENNFFSNSQDQPFFANFNNCIGYSVRSGTINLFAPNFFNEEEKESLNLNIIVPSTQIQERIQKLTARDYLDFLFLSQDLDQNQILQAFFSSGFPEKVAELLSAKFILRRNQLITVLKKQGFEFDLETKPLIRALHHIQDQEKIKNGILIEEYEEMRLDHTESVIENLMAQVVRPLLDSVEDVAKNMLAHFPYTGVEVLKRGDKYLGVGVLFRLKRSIEENPNSQSFDDRYLVQDSLKLGMTLNIGRNFKDAEGVKPKFYRRINLWATAGAGYAANYAVKRSVGSLEEAKEGHWLIPKKLILDYSFDSLKPGETFAVQQGFIGIGGTGGNFRFHRKLRLAGYMLLSLNFFNNFQVTVNKDGGLYILRGQDDRWTYQTKFFLRLVNRFLRVPFLGRTFAQGLGYSKVFFVEKSKVKEPTALLALQKIISRTLTEKDVTDLETTHPFVKTSFKYKAESSFFNMFNFNYSLSRSSGDFDVETDLPFEGTYFVLKLNESLGRTANQNDERAGCMSTAVLEYEESQAHLKDGALSFKCYYRNVSKSFLKEHHPYKLLESVTAFSKKDLLESSLLTEVFGESPTEYYDLYDIQYSGEISWGSLKKLIVYDPQNNKFFIEKVEQLVEKKLSKTSGKENAKELVDLLRPHFSFFRIEKEEKKRFQHLMGILFKSYGGWHQRSLGNVMKDAFMEIFDKKYLSLSFYGRNLNNTKNTNTRIELGKKQTGSVATYLKWREVVGNTFIIDDY